VHDLRLNSSTHRLNFQASLAHPTFYPAYSLECRLRGNNSARTAMTLKALQWIAFAFQPLSLDELFAALTTRTNTERDIQGRCTVPIEALLESRAGLEELCAGLLITRSNGLIEFCDADLKTFVLSGALSTLDPCRETKVHEMMAGVCLHHLQCLQKETIFRPWLSTEQWLKREVRHCHLKGYSTSFWHEHYRIAEPCSRILPALLDQTVQSALADDGMEDGVKIFSPDIRVNAGLWICSLYDFKGLGKMYLQMGADIEYRHALDQTPLHIAAANSSAGMLRLLLDAGADPDRTDADGMNTLHHCCIAGLSEAVSLLIKRGVALNAAGCCCSRRTPCSCSMGRTPLQLAASHGHPVIVKLLLDACANLCVIRSSPKEATSFDLEYGSDNVVQTFLDGEISFEPGAAESENILQLATKERHTATVRLLREPDTRTSRATSDDERYLEKAFQPLGTGDTVRRFQELSVE